MPIKSKSQMKRFEALVKEGKMRLDIFEKMKNETPHIKHLPERIGGLDDQTTVKTTPIGKVSKVVK